MEKGKCALLLIIFVFSAFSYAQELDTEQPDQIKSFRDNGFKFTGPGAQYLNYKDGTLIVPKDKDAVIQIPENYKADLKVEGGTVVVPKSFNGKIEAKDATIYVESNVFHGRGSYSKSDGFTIKEGSLNELLISNAHGVNYDLEKQTFTGTVDKGCKDENENHVCQIAGQNIGGGTDFAYYENTKKITLTGKPGTTTIPNLKTTSNPNIGYMKYKDENSKELLTGVTLGDMQLDTKNSKIFLAPGEVLPKETKYIKVEGISDRLEAHDKETQLIFEPYENGVKIKQVSSEYGSSNVAINKPDVDWSDEISKIKSLNTNDAAYIGGKRLDMDIGYDLEKEVGDNPKKYYVTYKDIEDVNKNLENNPEFLNFIKQRALESGLPEELIIAICAAESRCNPKLKCNGAGACGPFQVRYISVKDVVKQEQGYTDNGDTRLIRAAHEEFEKARGSPQKNTELGTKYAQQLIKICDGNIQCTLASYNAGMTRVMLSGGIPENKETPLYIQRVLAFYNHYKQKKVT